MSRDRAAGGGIRPRRPNESRLFAAVPGVVPRVATAAGVLALPALFWLAAGTPGALAGVGAVAAWALLGTPYGIALGATLLAAIGPDGGATLLLAGTAFLALLLSPVVAAPEPARYAGSVALAGGVLAVGTWLLVRAVAISLVAATLLVALVGLSYAVYRYHLLALGLLDAAADADDDDTAGDRA